MRLIKRLLVLLAVNGAAFLMFVTLMAIPNLSTWVLAENNPAADATWSVISPDPNVWITSTQPITVQVQVTDEFGINLDVPTSTAAFSPRLSVSNIITQYAYLPTVLGNYPCSLEAYDPCKTNTTITNALRLALNYQITASVNMTSDQSDYYRVTLSNKRPYTITETLVLPCKDPFPPGQRCDLDLYLYWATSPYTYVTASNIHGVGNEQIIYTPIITGDYAIRVYSFDTTYSVTRYSLIVK
jgi:hypothetical protein